MKKITKYSILIIVALNIFVPIYAAQAQASWQQIFPQCIQDQMNAKSGVAFTKECDDIGVFIQLAINVGAYLFTFIGALALLVFVYGGFKMIISAGDTAKIKEGKDAMVAAVIGIVIAFSGVAIVKLLGDSIHLSEKYQLNQQEDKVICCKSPNETQSEVGDGNIQVLNYSYKFIKKSSCDDEVLDAITNQIDCENLGKVNN